MLELRRLTKAFDRRRPVLDALDLQISSSDRIALIGSNGAGKTTLFRCLLGQYRYRGEISIDGRDATRRDVPFLSRVAFVPQLPPPLRMPVGALMDFAARCSGADKDLMAHVAERLAIDLEPIRHQLFYRLSGGQKQKILITIALARDVALMIFDEPSANLDPAARTVFIDLLAERRDTAMLIASHRLEEVAPFVNRVIELDRGHISLDDKVADRLRAGEIRRCVVRLLEPQPTFVQALSAWGFKASADGRSCTGEVPGAESFRFLATLSRYANAIDRLTMESAGNPGIEALMCICDRRRFMFAGLAVALAVAGCRPQTEGPEEIRYGRETCAMCGMIISDSHFAAEIRGGPDKALWKFDDIGDAVNWLEMQPWRDSGLLEFWVMDHETGTKWLDARDAWYVTDGVLSPMDYGFGAVGGKVEGAVDFARMRELALNKGLTSRCTPEEERAG